MSSVFARCTALGLVAGGFALTGDLGWVAERGMRVLNSSSIPTEEAAAPSGGEGPSAAGREVVEAARAAPLPAAPRHDVGPVFPGADIRPPTDGPEQANIAALDAGNRIVVWIAGQAGARSGRCLVLDVVDPASAEALLYEAVSFSPTGQPIAAAAAPRRVKVSGAAGGMLVRGQSFGLRRLGVATPQDGPADEFTGPIVALAIVR